MDTLHIEATKQFPQITLSPNGHLKLIGRLINDHLYDYFHPVYLWIDKARCEHIQFDIALEYLNTTGAFHIVELMHRIEANKSFKCIEIIWHYDEDDEEHYDLGQFIEQKMKRSAFKYLSHASSD